MPALRNVPVLQFWNNAIDNHGRVATPSLWLDTLAALHYFDTFTKYVKIFPGSEGY